MHGKIIIVAILAKPKDVLQTIVALHTSSKYY